MKKILIYSSTILLFVIGLTSLRHFYVSEKLTFFHIFSFIGIWFVTKPFCNYWSNFFTEIYGEKK
jgi:hypothetical protein